MSDKSPPWVLFTDQGRPVAILPAMRSGEVAKVGHLTMAEAQEIVRTANRLHHLLVEAKFKWAEAELERLTARLQSAQVTK